jgi:hypothetical protein
MALVDLEDLAGRETSAPAGTSGPWTNAAYLSCLVVTSRPLHRNS